MIQHILKLKFLKKNIENDFNPLMAANRYIGVAKLTLEGRQADKSASY